MTRLFILCFLAFSLSGCGTPSSATISELQQGKRYFDQGYYKKAMRDLLPLACDGLPDAQYGVGYMYYYGLGVAQDTDVGYFWIKRAAKARYLTAINALEVIDHGKEKEVRIKNFVRE